MKRIARISQYCFTGAVLLAAGAVLFRAKPQIASETLIHECVLANNAFALDLYAKLAPQHANMVLAPLSLSASLAMTYAGARGETARQMAAVLRLPDEGDNVHAGVGGLLKEVSNTNASTGQLAVANSLWQQEGASFKRSFRRIVRNHYAAKLSLVDFKTSAASAEAARQQINDWVAAQTQGRIPSLLEVGAVHIDTRMVLANAVYFKGQWLTPFDERWTRTSPFHLADGKSASVAMMNESGTFRLAETDSLQMLEIVYADTANLTFEEIPYVSNRFSMMILLPREIDGLGQLERTLTVELLDQLQAKSQLREVGVSIPRFKVDSDFHLKRELGLMGMSRAFSEADADFTGISELRPLFIDLVSHKALVEVDEKGTEATAATAVALTHSASMPTAVFNADHPFLFLILHRPTGTILFIGRITDPSK